LPPSFDWGAEIDEGRMLPGFECRSGRAAGNVPLDLKFAGQRFAALSLV
jgi:hypothetical protein